MNDLENICHEEQSAKRGTQFGIMSQKLCSFEIPCTLGNDWIISPQPFIRCSWSWTFWKWEREIFNFHVGQNFIWSFFDVGSWVEVGSKTCHFWKVEIIGHFPFLETFDLTSNSSTLIFGMMNKHDLDMNEMKKTQFLNSKSTVDFSVDWIGP